MKTLHEISRLVTKKRLKKIELFTPKTGKGRKSYYYKLYKGLINGDYGSDIQAAKYLYGCCPSDKKYLMLKSRVKERLLNMLFFLDYRNTRNSGYYKAYYECTRKMDCARVLLLQGARRSGIQLIKEILLTAQKYRLNEILFFCTRMLVNHCSFTGLKKDYSHYIHMQKTVFREIETELIAEEYYQTIRIEFIRQVSPPDFLIRLCQNYLMTLKQLSRHHTSYLLHFNMYRLWIYYHQLKGNYRQAIKICNQAETYLRNNPLFDQKVRRGELMLMKMDSCMQLMDYKNGQQYAYQCMDLFTHGSNNYFIFLEHYFLLLIHTKKYILAKFLLDDVMIWNPGFIHMSPERQEKWKIFQAYLNFLLPPTTSSNKMNRFKINKFLNEVPILSKDKKGYNVVILIAQLLFLLEQKDFDGIYNKIEALQKYSSRYLSKERNYRSKCFIKMLLTIGKYHFNERKVKQKSIRYLLQLQSAPMTYRGTAETLEIIPYEHLWAIILQRMKMQK